MVATRLVAPFREVCSVFCRFSVHVFYCALVEMHFMQFGVSWKPLEGKELRDIFRVRGLTRIGMRLFGDSLPSF